MIRYDILYAYTAWILFGGVKIKKSPGKNYKHSFTNENAALIIIILSY